MLEVSQGSSNLYLDVFNVVDACPESLAYIKEIDAIEETLAEKMDTCLSRVQQSNEAHDFEEVAENRVAFGGIRPIELLPKLANLIEYAGGFDRRACDGLFGCVGYKVFFNEHGCARS